MTGIAELFQYRSDTKILSAGDCFYARSTRQRTHSTRAQRHSPAQLLPAGLIACRSHRRAATCLVGIALANANRSSRHAIRSRRSVVRARRVCPLAQDLARPDPFQVYWVPTLMWPAHRATARAVNRFNPPLATSAHCRR